MASALIILLLVFLIFFGVLSLVTSAADLRLAQKRADWNQGYFLADAQAEEVYGDIEQYCQSLEPPQLAADALAGLLEQRLAARTDIREYTVARDEQGILLDILVMHPQNKIQGIQMRLRIKPGEAAAGEGSRLTIESWIQWQEPFQYDQGNGGVWKG